MNMRVDFEHNRTRARVNVYIHLTLREHLSDGSFIDYELIKVRAFRSGTAPKDIMDAARAQLESK